MRGFVERRLGGFVTALALLCVFEIGHSAWKRAVEFRNFKGQDFPSHVVSIFRPLRSKIPYRAKFNIRLEKDNDIAIKRLAQFALAPRQIRAGTDEPWLIYYSASGAPLPADLAKSRRLILVSKGGAQLYVRDE